MGIKNRIIITGEPAQFKRYRRVVYSLMFLGMAVVIFLFPFTGVTATIWETTRIHPYVWSIWLLVSSVVLLWDTVRGAVINALWLGAFWVYSAVAGVTAFTGLRPAASLTLSVMYIGLSLILLLEFFEDARTEYTRRPR